MPADPNLSRRQFLKQSAAGVATAGLTLEAARVAEAAPAALPKSKVVVVTNSAIGAPEEAEMVFKLMEHAAANVDHPIKKLSTEPPFLSRYQYQD